MKPARLTLISITCLLALAVCGAEEPHDFKARYDLSIDAIPQDLFLRQLGEMLNCGPQNVLLSRIDNQIEVEGSLSAHLRVLEIVAALRSPVVIGSETSGVQDDCPDADSSRILVRAYDCTRLGISDGVFVPHRVSDLAELLGERLFLHSFAASKSYIAEFCGRIVVIQRAPVQRCIEAALTRLAKHRSDRVLKFAPEQLLVRNAEVDSAIDVAITRLTPNSKLKSFLLDLSKAPLMAYETAEYLIQASFHREPCTSFRLYSIADLTHAPELAIGTPPHELTDADVADRLKAVCPDKWDLAQCRFIAEWSQDWLQVEQTPEIHALLAEELNKLRLKRIVRAICSPIPALPHVLQSFWPGSLDK